PDLARFCSSFSQMTKRISSEFINTGFFTNASIQPIGKSYFLRYGRQIYAKSASVNIKMQKVHIYARYVFLKSALSTIYGDTKCK
ncbi:hypothetical protein, partial [Bartonella sp. AC70YNML]|uniref:hypothetical protein n=1 Tax=Bartonella sp. AC70YNML TaxID=3243460 RepID=UPI0035CF640B